MFKFSCPYLKAEVELTAEREQHIAENHPDLLPEHRSGISDALADPDEIRRSRQSLNALLFSRQFEGALDGKYIVVVVMTDDLPDRRNWIATAYIARKLVAEEIEWKRD